MTRRALVWWIALLSVCALAGAWHWRALHRAESAGVLIAGGDGGGLPRAEAAAEGFDDRALQAAAASTFERGASALLIVRHGHLVFEKYARGVDADTRLDGGELADTLLVICAGIAVAKHGMIIPAPPLQGGELTAAVTAASGLSYPMFLSRHVWQPLGAASARWLSPGVSARAGDWLRVGEVLLHDGRFEGTQIVPAGWLAQHARVLSRPGGAPVAADGVFGWRGPGATRLWLVPRFDVAILRVADQPPPGAAVDETLARTIIAALRERPATGGASLNDLVPGH